MNQKRKQNNTTKTINENKHKDTHEETMNNINATRKQQET